MAFPREKIAIIGSGIVGITSIVGMKEAGLDPVCFEQTDKPGGTWCYRDKEMVGLGSTMNTTILNHSKEMGAFSNFPPRKDFNNFMRHREMYQYLMDYATEKDVLRHIQYNSEVVTVKKATDYLDTGNWIVTVRNTLSGELTSDIFNGVLVCIGHLNRPKMVDFPGQESFKGVIMHTHSLKGVSEFRNKNVVVVGMGCSALDAAVESSDVAKQVYISTRTGAHVFKRKGPYGFPYDYILLRRYILCLLDFVPSDILGWLLENLYMDLCYDQNLYPVKPDHHVLAKDPIINDFFHSKLHDGSIKQVKNIKNFTEKGIIFEGDSEETQADVVIMATGYTWKFPFLEDDIFVQDEGRINLYNCMFPPHLEHPTLAFNGFLLVFGPGFPLGEMQGRYAAHIFSGKGKLPSKEEMLKTIKDRHEKNLQRYTASDRMTVRIDFVQYLDELASIIGAKPNFMKIFFTDIRLFFKLVFGPCLSYQYRLQGPYRWDGARDAIMESDERVKFPLTKTISTNSDGNVLLKFIQKMLKMIIN